MSFIKNDDPFLESIRHSIKQKVESMVKDEIDQIHKRVDEITKVVLAETWANILIKKDQNMCDYRSVYTLEFNNGEK